MPRGVVYEPETDEDLQSVGLLVEEDEDEDDPGDSTESGAEAPSEEEAERVYTQQELDAHAEGLKRNFQSLKDREVAKVNRRVAALEDELVRERELSNTYKKFADKWWEMDASSKDIVDDLVEKHGKQSSAAQAEATKLDAEEQAVEAFNARWVNTMEELAEDVVELGLSSSQFNEAVLKYSTELMSSGDWDSFRRKARKEIRALKPAESKPLADKVPASKSEPTETPKRKVLVPVKSGGASTPPHNWADMDDAEMLRAEQELIDSHTK